MRKSGLHKQISSIFDGVPMPKNNTELESQESAPPLIPPTQPVEGESVTEKDIASPAAETLSSAPAIPTSQKPSSSLVKRLSADPSECTSAPSIQINRPMPLPKSAIATSPKKPGMSVQLKKMLFGANRGSLDARQKKMAGLVGILSVVFGAVMFISFGGVSGSKASAAQNTDTDTTPVAASARVNPADWEIPQSLPENLRNATIPVAPKVDPTQTQSEQINTEERIVKGIVFSQTNPSAIINNEIYVVGQRVNGALITNITKTAVEFEVNGNRWSQQVQR
jgi:hypothetical protein